MWPSWSDTYKWNIIYRVFRDDFLDVTLACEDGQQIGTHKVILLSSSPLERKMGINYKVDSTTNGLNYKVESTNVQSGLNIEQSVLDEKGLINF